MANWPRVLAIVPIVPQASTALEENKASLACATLDSSARAANHLRHQLELSKQGTTCLADLVPVLPVISAQLVAASLFLAKKVPIRVRLNRVLALNATCTCTVVLRDLWLLKDLVL